jgi:drug/metabolite transporter (DMT)-like permease
VSETPPSRAAIAGAFAALYVVWGSTYWAIAVTVQSLPAFATGGLRFLCAGILLFAWLRWRGAPLPTAPQWRSCFIIGSLLFIGGNGCVCWAERWVPSGEASLMVAATPLWMAIIPWLARRGPAPRPMAWVGIVLGIVGVGVLVGSPGHAAVGGHEAAGRAALIIASLSWSFGAAFSKWLPLPPSALMSSAAQMITGGAAMILCGFAFGERIDLASASAASLWALLYLILIGSLVGFAAFTFLLRWTTPARVSTYAFVNPLVAVLLGAAALHESLGARQAVAGALILGAVAAILMPAPREAAARAAA